MIVAVVIAAVLAVSLAFSLAVSRSNRRRLEARVREASAVSEERARRADQLQDELALKDQTLSAMAEGVIVASGDDVIYANDAARRFFPELERGGLPAAAPRPAPGRPATTEISLHHPARRDLRCTAVTLADGRMLIVAQDVTEARRVDRIRRDFVADASHEMKTPIAAMLATAETLEHAVRDDPDAAARFATTLAGDARKLSLLIADLLDLARFEELEPGDARVSLSGVVSEVVRAAREEARTKGIGLSAEIAPDVTVSGRAEDLRALPDNLLRNALQYTPRGGAVRVGVSAGDGRARLVVADTGAGIPAKDLPRIFERFYRVDRARARETGGTGLGLAIVRHVAERHGGSVRAESALGQGSTFTVELPLG